MDSITSYIQETALPTTDSTYTSTIKTPKSSKYPGPADLKLSFYKSCAALLCPVMTQAFNSIDDTHTLLVYLLRLPSLPDLRKILSYTFILGQYLS